jgi:type VI secretion system protein VasG
MIGVDIKSLLRRLNRFCTRTLEGAAGLCVSRGHYEVTVEHFLFRMADDPGADLYQILRRFEIEPAHFQKALQRAVEDFKTGNAGKPVFSPLLIEWFQDAWLMASVELGLAEIRSGVLAAVLVDRPSRYTSGAFVDLLDKISKEDIRKNLLSIVEQSSESAQAMGTATGAGAEALAAGRRQDGESALARFTMDFTGRARAGEIDPVFGRDREIRQMIDILGRRRKNNPIVVGEAGVGKTAVVEGLALKIVQGDVPSILSGVELLGLDLGLLQAGAGVKGEFENRLKAVISEVKESPKPIVLFIDEAHTIIGAGGSVGGGDAANLLKPALARGELRTVAATTWSEYKKYFEKDAALARRFQLVKLDEPSEQDTILMLRGLRENYEASHKIRILDEAVVEAVKLSSRYISGRQLPDKAVDLLDTCAARVRIGLSSRPGELEDANRRIQTLERELVALERDQAAGVPVESVRIEDLKAKMEEARKDAVELESRWLREKEAVDRVLALRAAIENIEPPPQGVAQAGASAPAPAATGSVEVASPVLTPEEAKKDLEPALASLREIQGKSPFIPTEVNGEVIAKVVADWTGIPLGKMVRDESQTILQFDNRLRERIKGQDHAIETLGRGIRAAKAGLQNPRTPIGVFLFVGPSGVGKTESALGLADLLFGGERFMATINMSEFQEKHTVSRLIGSPPGYVGYGEGGVLTEAVRQRPYSVVLLDEVEKADPEVLNIFYQVFDKGMLADGEGRVVDFKNTIIILTSNLASETIVSMSGGPVRPDVDELMNAIRPALIKHFKPALLGRMTVVPFYPISTDAMKEIVSLKLNQVGKRLMESQRMKFDFDPSVVELISQRCTEVESGARNIDHIINGTLLPLISTEILERMGTGTLTDSLKVELDSENNFRLQF